VWWSEKVLDELVKIHYDLELLASCLQCVTVSRSHFYGIFSALNRRSLANNSDIWSTFHREVHSVAYLQHVSLRVVQWTLKPLIVGLWNFEALLQSVPQKSIAGLTSSAALISTIYYRQWLPKRLVWPFLPEREVGPTLRSGLCYRKSICRL